jgi:hypothetical protein
MANGTQKPAVRDVWWAQVDKQRLCVVVSADDVTKTFEVVYGQSQRDPAVPDIEVLLGSYDGTRLKVRNDTYFRETNKETLVQGDFRQFVVKCPAGLFTKIERMLATAAGAKGVARPAAAGPVAKP